jgi:hypothetical protein
MKGYYSYDEGSFWHIIVLNSECAQIGGCTVGSPQEVWLRADLAANTSRNVLAMWHKPLFSSGSHQGTDSQMQAMWNALFEYGAELVLTAHDHTTTNASPLRIRLVWRTPRTVFASLSWGPAVLNCGRSARSKRTAKCATTVRTA